MTRIIEWTQPLHDIFDHPLTRDIYYHWVISDDPRDATPWIAHVCKRKRPDGWEGWTWSWGGTGNHTLISREPLHLEPSIGWMACCGRHGWIRNGQWEPAGEEGQGFPEPLSRTVKSDQP